MVKPAFYLAGLLRGGSEKDFIFRIFSVVSEVCVIMFGWVDLICGLGFYYGAWGDCFNFR